MLCSSPGQIAFLQYVERQLDPADYFSNVEALRKKRKISREWKSNQQTGPKLTRKFIWLAPTPHDEVDQYFLFKLIVSSALKYSLLHREQVWCMISFSYGY